MGFGANGQPSCDGTLSLGYGCALSASAQKRGEAVAVVLTLPSGPREVLGFKDPPRPMGQQNLIAVYGAPFEIPVERALKVGADCKEVSNKRIRASNRDAG